MADESSKTKSTMHKARSIGFSRSKSGPHATAVSDGRSPEAAKIERLFRQALTLHQKGDARSAALGYERVLQIQPNHFESLHYLGLIRAQQNRNDEAMTLLRSAVEQNPFSSDARVNLAVLFETLNRPEDAIVNCRAALAIKSDSAEAHFTAANAYKKLGLYQEAADHFQKVIAIRPEYVEAYYNLGNIFSTLKLNDHALECYSQAVRLRPGYTRALNNRGIALQRQNHYSLALIDFDQAIAIKSDYFEALINRGNTLAALERPEEAIASYDRAISLTAKGAGVEGRGITILDGRKTPIQVNAWHYGEALAYHGKAMVLRPIDLQRSTECLKRALELLIDAGGLGASKAKTALTRYPSDAYPEALRATIHRLSMSGIEPFLTGGTLLGATRDLEFIGFDKDIDFGIRSTVTFADLQNAFAGDPDFELTWDPGEDGFLISYFWRGKVAIDFFRFFFEKDLVWCGLHYGGHLLKWLHSPFELVDLDWQGVTVKVPSDSDRFLTEVYGDWRTPNPYFGLFASPNIEGGFPPISRNIAYSAIAIALSRDEATKAIELCRQVLELAPDDALIGTLREKLIAFSRDESAPATSVTTNADEAMMQGLGPARDDVPA